MVIDELVVKTKSNKIIEVFVQENGVGIWIPVMGTDLRLMNRDADLIRVRKIRIRSLKPKKIKEVEADEKGHDLQCSSGIGQSCDCWKNPKINKRTKVDLKK